jgi:uncharacterized ion transporter superfamily protein YfcC
MIKNKDSYIIAAGEVGSYTVCPESWRLQYVKKAQKVNTLKEQSKQGKVLHKRWSKKYDESMNLLFGGKVIIFLLFLSIFLVILALYIQH